MYLNFFIPGDLNTLTGGYIYDKRIIEGLNQIGHSVKVFSLSSDFPFPSIENKLNCQLLIHSIPKGEILIFDSLVFGAIPDLLCEIDTENTIVALVHLPLSINEGFSFDKRKSLSILEKEAFKYADLVIVTSNFTSNLLIGAGVDQASIEVIIPGVEVLMHKMNYSKLPNQLITVSNYTQNKGYLQLIKGLSNLKQYDWMLNCYGNKNFDPEYVKAITDLITENQMSDRILLHDSATGIELSKIYANADLIIHPSEFETYGMVLTEALAHGIPLVASTGGAITQTVPASMGLFFNLDDKNSLNEILIKILSDSELYTKLCSEASKYIITAQSWQNSVLEFEFVLKNKAKSV